MSEPFFQFVAQDADHSDIAQRVRPIVERDLSIESIEVPRDLRQGALTLRGRLRTPSHDAFPAWTAALRPLGYTPMLRHDPAGGPGAVIVTIIVGVPPHVPSRPWINITLFVLTLISTLFTGSLYGGDPSRINAVSDLFLPQNILQGWPFAVTLLGILLAHEFGHYFAARAHRVAVSLPFFIPMPLGFGTLGAFIRLKEPVPDRRKLFDIGVAGPLAGLLLAVPLLFVGLSTSSVDVPPVGAGIMLEGNSLLYYFAKLTVFGQPLPNPATGQDVFMNQVTFAAWIGLLVTALNLLPVGQLDGGHTVYALFGPNARIANNATLIAMAVLAIAGLPFLHTYLPALREIGFTGWWLWLFLIRFVLGPTHPPALDDVTELDTRRRWLGYFVILVFIVTFVPTPFREL